MKKILMICVLIPMLNQAQLYTSNSQIQATSESNMSYVGIGTEEPTSLLSVGSEHGVKLSIGKAMNYAYIRWDALSAYLYDGNLQIDNNLVENAILPIALGRKNHLFAGSHQAAHVLQ